VNASAHLSTEQISDLLAGVPSATEAMAWNAHLASCETCAERRADLLDVMSWLAEESAEPPPMPDDIAARVDDTLARASVERTARGEVSAVRQSAVARPLKWLAGAAAAVTVISLGVAGLRALPHHANSTDNAGPGADTSQGVKVSLVPSAGAAHGLAGSPGGSTGRGPADGLRDDYSVSAGQVPSLAQSLASTSLRAGLPRYAPTRFGCAEPLTGDSAVVIRFEGHRAVLSLDRSTRLATVYDCATATQTLLVTGY
jgi:hypothetical protein